MDRRNNNMATTVCFLKITVLSLIIFSGFIFPRELFAATYYMPDDFANLQSAFSEMASGDTLIIRDGRYVGIKNMISHSQHPPNGSTGAYTIIKAENEGKVVFDGEGVRQMFSLYGGGQAGNFHHMQFEGIGFSNSDKSLVSLTYTDHIKMLKCFCYDAGGTGHCCDGFSIGFSSYILLEDCWSYGAARKHFYIGKSAEKVIVRRCVVRHDRHFDYSDQEAFMFYDCKESELQNCISIDGNQGNYYTGGDPAAKSFTVRNTSAGFELENTYVRGCMSIGNKDMMGVLGSAYNPTTFIDFIHWDSKWGSRLRGADSNFKHCTLGNVTGTGTFSPLMYLEMHDPVTDSIFYSAYRGIWNAVGNDYNSLYNIDIEYSGCSAGGHSYCNANSNAIDPIDGSPGNGTAALKYLCRIEDGSDLDGAASDGGDIGATIIKRIGKSGTLWGEPGYNLLQDGTNGQADEDLWPFPNEDIIREHMRAYTYDDGSGGAPEISGARGFCADGQTLTNYIWGYLGNTVPPFNVKASPGNQKVYLSWNANAEPAGTNITKYKIYWGTSSGNHTTGSQDADGTVTSATVTGLTNQKTYYFVVTAVDGTKGESGYGYEVSATPKPVAITSPSPSGGFHIGPVDNGNGAYDSYTITGTADAGATVDLFADTIPLGTVAADGKGEWSLNVDFSSFDAGKVYLRAESGGVSSDIVTGMIRGDVNGDDAIDSGDAIRVLRFSVALISLSVGEKWAGNVTDKPNDEYIDSGDAIKILRYSVGLIDDF